MAKQYKKVDGKLEVKETKTKDEVSLYTLEFLNEQRARILLDTNRTVAELAAVDELIAQAINLGVE